MRLEERALAARRRGPVDSLIATVAVALSVALLILDLAGPEYLVAARFYVLPMLIVALFSTTRTTLALSITSVALTLVAIAVDRRFDLDHLLLLGLIALVGLFSYVLSKTLERTRRQTEALRSVNEAGRLVNATSGLPETLEPLLRLSRQLFDADSTRFGLYGASTRDTMKVISETGEIFSGEQFQLVHEAAVSSTAERAVTLFVDDTEGSSGTAASVPLLLRRRSIGILYIYWTKHRLLSSDERGIIELFADQAAVAIDNSRLFEEASQANLRLGELLDLGRGIASRQDVDDVVEAVTSAVKQIMDSAVATVMIADEADGRLRVRGRGAVLRDREGSGHDDNCERLAYRVLELARRAASTDTPFLEAFNLDCSEKCRFAELTSHKSFHSVVALPLISGDRTLGALSCYRLHDERIERPFDDADISTLEALAAMTSIALANSTEIAKQRSISDALQSSLLPRAIPRTPDLSIGTYYASATSGAFVGGDFFDFIPFEDGRMAIFIGDVCGSGIDAASDTAMAKYMIRMIAEEEPSPAGVVKRVNTAVAGAISPGRFITLFYTVYDPASDALSYASAGHHSPVMVRGRSATQLPMDSGPALGIIKGTEYTNHSISLNVDDVLVMYTDGLVEARRDGELLGAEGVGEFLVKQADLVTIAPRELAARLPELAMSYSSGHLADDLAVVVIRRTAPV